MTNPRGFKGVFGMPGQIQKQSHLVIPELKNCNSRFYYYTENLEDGIRTNEKLILLFLGRIDNHSELCGKFNFPVDSSDIDLLVRAYELFGEGCPEQIIGDFSFAIFDKEEQKLLLAKDQVGVKPLFYLIKEGYLFFATTIYDLVGLLKDKEALNKEYIAKELLNYEQEVEDTFYQNIMRLKPAHYLVIGAESKVQISQYWDLTPIDLSNNTDKEIYKLLRVTLEEAITCRIRKASNVGCQLSGGIDSSAIAVLLSRLMQKDSLHTYSFVLNEETKKYSKSGIDEKNTQKIIIDYAGLKQENHHPVERFHFKSVFEEWESTQGLYAGAANSNSIWQESMFKLAAEENQVDVMFSGFPGDEGISYSGSLYYFDYIGNFNIKALAGMFFTQPLKTIRKILFYYRSFFRGSYKKGYSKLLKSRSLLRSESAFHKTIKHHSFKFYSTFKKFQKAQMLRSHTCLRIESEGLFAEKYGIETVYPLADIRLLQLVHSLPARFFKPGKNNRLVFRNLCMGILPEEVRLQPKSNGAYTLAFADYWILNKYESLKDYQIEDKYGLFIDPDQYKSQTVEGDIIMKKGIVNLKMLDYLINRNWPQ